MNIEMNENVRKMWVDALESGKYKQVRKALTIEENGVVGHCCLGVLSELAVQEGVIPPREVAYQGKGNTYYSYGAYGSDTTVLPLEVMEWAGIVTEEGVMPTYKGRPENTLVGLNDAGMSFEEIAAVIKS